MKAIQEPLAPLRTEPIARAYQHLEVLDKLAKANSSSLTESHLFMIRRCLQVLNGEFPPTNSEVIQ